MRGFLEYLLEKKETEEAKNIVKIASKNELSKVSNEYLKVCFKWLFDRFGKDFIQRIDYDANLSQSTHGGIHGFDTIIWSKSHYRTSRREEAAEKILKSFEDGPLFFPKKSDSSRIDFLWYANKDSIDEKLKDYKKYKDNSRIVGKFKIFCGQKLLDNLLKGSEGSRYSFGYYSVDASKEEIAATFGQGKEITKEAKGRTALDANKIKIETKVIVDFTIKSEEKANILINNTSDLIELLELPFKISREKSEINADKDYFKIDVLKGISTAFKDEVNKALQPKENIISEIESDFYSKVFSAILENKVSSTTFDMDALFKNDIVRNFVENETGYGVILSEILIPFCLVVGYKNIKSKDGQIRTILKFRKRKEKLESIEIPVSNKNVLTDYNAIFANTKDPNGKLRKYAISAKFDVAYNRPSLFTLLNDKLKRNQNALDKANELLKFIGSFVKDSTKLSKEVEECAIGYCKLRQSEKIAEDFLSFLDSDKLTEEKIKKGIENFTNIKNPGLVNNIVKYFRDAKPILCDWFLAKELSKKNDFLFALYDFVFSFYGEDIDFQQINLDKKFNLKYYSRSKNVTEKNSNQYIQLSSSSGFSEVESESPKPRVIQPLQVNLLKEDKS